MKDFNLDEEIQRFEMLTENAGDIQKETLRKILEQNGETEYLRGFGLGERTDPESFRARVPLVTHEDIEPYMQRIVNGDFSPVLTDTPIKALSLSTGTTQGKSKFLIYNEAMWESTVRIYRTSFAFINREYPIEEGKAIQFIYATKQFVTNGGLIATTGTTNIYQTKDFTKAMKDLRSECCSPAEVVFGEDYDQSLYCHLLCGLIHSAEVQFVSSPFIYNIVHAFKTFEQVWEELCNDIREGTLSHKITVPSIRDSVCKLLTPNPTLADRIYNKCKSLSKWYGLIPELWPNAKYVYGIMTGSMEPYVKKMRHYAGNLPLLSAYYGASEGWVGANVNPASGLESVAYAVFPDIGYFEFIPLSTERNDYIEKDPVGLTEVEIDKEYEIVMTNFAVGHGKNCTVNYTEKDPVGLTEVEIGNEYEIVMTNFAGLYRYRLGDIVKVAGFHNSTPELQFVCRRNLLLSITIDKNSEKDLQIAINEAADILSTRKLEVVDFACQADISSDPGHYVIFLELNANDADEDCLSGCCNCLDLAFVESAYVRSRNGGTIGPLELRVVRSGTFQRVRDHYVANGTTANQFKMPRCISSSNEKVLQILSSNVVDSYFSTAYG